jgi:WhiB family transcriptional regulator, redox-sensing transcriptional regulator
VNDTASGTEPSAWNRAVGAMEPWLPAGELRARLVVVSPHPDDETLGVGGLTGCDHSHLCMVPRWPSDPMFGSDGSRGTHSPMRQAKRDPIYDLVKSNSLATKPPAWVRFAACRGHSTTLFFGPADETARRRVDREDEARAICSRCPARSACRDYARMAGEIGIWGGENELERTRRRRWSVSILDCD